MGICGVSRSARRGGRGFTLVELLVALLISAVLLGGVLSISLGGQQFFRAREKMGRAQEALWRSAEVLKRTLSMAESVHPESGADRIIIRYAGGEGVRNCLGAVVTSGRVVNHFYVQRNALYCSTAYPAEPGSARRLVEGVVRMTVWYGVEGRQQGQVERYLGAPDDWDRVLSARIQVQAFDPPAPQRMEATLTVAMRPRIFARLEATGRSEGSGDEGGDARAQER